MAAYVDSRNISQDIPAASYFTRSPAGRDLTLYAEAISEQEITDQSLFGCRYTDDKPLMLAQPALLESPFPGTP